MSACDKATGKAEKITITNDKGRLSKEEIEKMVADADKFKAQDDAIRKKIEGKNGLENYCFQMKNTLNDEKLKNSFTNEEKKIVEDTANEGLQFIESDPEMAADYEAKQKELEAKFNPIMMRVYQEAGVSPGAGGMPGGMGAAPGGAPTPNAEMDDLD